MIRAESDAPWSGAARTAPWLNGLRAVVAVAQFGGTAPAAQRVPLSQPAISRAIAQVERALGLPLFARTAVGMLPTPAGRIVAARAERALRLLAEGDAASARFARNGASPVGRVAARVASRQLDALLAVARHGGLRRAAAALAMTPSAVQQALAGLEHLAPGRLFERGRGVWSPTAAGREMARAASLAAAELRSADEELQALAGRLEGRIVIGTLPYSATLFVPAAIEQVLAAHPDVRVVVVDGTFEDLLHRLRHAEVDVIAGALRDAPPGGDVAHRPLFDDAVVAVVRHDHPVASSPALGLAALRALPWVLPMPGSPACLVMEHAFAAEGLAAPEASLRVNSLPMTLALLRQTDRVALVPARQVQAELDAGLLRILSALPDWPARRIGLMLRSDFQPAPPMRHMLDALSAAVACSGYGK